MDISEPKSVTVPEIALIAATSTPMLRGDAQSLDLSPLLSAPGELACLILTSSVEYG